MNKPKLESKVGFFVLVCLVLLALLLLQFSKGTTFLRPTYTIVLTAKNVGGLKERASVLMSGVQVGTVAKNVLADDGRSVAITLKVFSKFKIYPDARFVIESSGFLGDQYVAIYPTANEGQALRDGSIATAKEPFNLQEAAQSAKGFIDGVNATARKLDAAVDDIRRQVLNEQTLSNLAVTVSNFRLVSADARGTLADLHRLVVTNEAPAAGVISNLDVFSNRLIVVGETAQGILSNNAPQIASAINNLEATTASLTNLMADLQAGRGLVGSLLKDDQLSTNFSEVVSNFSVTSSNLNQLGLWRLFFPKHPAANPNK